MDEWFKMCKVNINQSKTLAKKHAKSVKHFDEQAKEARDKASTVLHSFVRSSKKQSKH